MNLSKHDAAATYVANAHLKSFAPILLKLLVLV